jgi:hypothetical protein
MMAAQVLGRFIQWRSARGGEPRKKKERGKNS